MFPRKLALGVIILFAVVAAAYWASLLHSLNGLEAGFRDRDVVKLEKYVDWVRIRKQIRSEIKSATTTHFLKEARGNGGGGAALFGTLIAGAVAPAMIDHLVNDLVTARALARLLGDKSLLRGEFLVNRIGLTDIDEYTLSARNREFDPDQEIKLILRRDGTTWRIVAIDVGPTELLLEKLKLGAGLEVEKLTPGAGLEVTVKPTRTAVALHIPGTISNKSDVPRRIPRLRISLRDGNKAELEAKVIAPPAERLEPGQSIKFETIFEHPSITATGVAVTFTEADGPEPGVALRSQTMNDAVVTQAPEASKVDATTAAQRVSPEPRQAHVAPRPKQDPPAFDKLMKTLEHKPAEKQPEAPAFDALLKNLNKEQTIQSDEPPQPRPKVRASAPLSSQPKAPLGSQLTASENDFLVNLIKQQLVPCWNVPAGAREAKELSVRIRGSLNPDGTVRTASIVDQGRMSDPLVRAAAESARRTFFNPQCTPLKLPADKYEVWKDLDITFDPRDVL